MFRLACSITGFLCVVKTPKISYAVDFVAPSSWDIHWDQRSPKCMLGSQSSDTDSDSSSSSLNRRMEEIESEMNVKLIMLMCVPQLEHYQKTNSSKSLRSTQITSSQLNLQKQHFLSLFSAVQEYDGVTRYSVKALTLPFDSEKFYLRLYEQDLNSDSCEMLAAAVPFISEPPAKFLPYSSDDDEEEGLSLFKSRALAEAAFREHIYRYDEDEDNLDIVEEVDRIKVIVAHSPTIAYLICRSLQLPPEAWSRFKIHHGSVTSLVIDERGNVFVMGLGECSYMPPQLMTY